ncbi:helicase RepA family protein [Williamsia herbipolensis]|uniref:Helicase RepA family protein n=1 Tax=Williamsia herbipolensis TaxID=1603258 RepID=A0AAU4K1X7_9NOCA|nr:AAA family ATPase [Williamsia herbipolensis]
MTIALTPPFAYGTEYDENGFEVETVPVTPSVLDVIDLIAGDDLDAMEFPDLEWAVRGVVPEGFGLIVAPPKAGKSWLVAGIGLACATGGVALGHIPVEQRPVLYMALEDGRRRLQSRYRTLLQGAPIPAEMVSVTDLKLQDVTEVIAAFCERNAGRKPLVVLDTLGKVKPAKKANADSYQADYAIGSALKRVIDAHPGSTLLAVHHTRKAESEDFVDAVSGTHGIAGSADFILVLSRKRQSQDAVLAITGRDVAETEVALVTDGGAWSLTSSSLTQATEDAVIRRERSGKSDRTIRALEYVKSRPTTRPPELAAWLDINIDDAGRYLRRMYDDGLIDKQSRGLYRPVSEASEVSERFTTSDAHTLSDSTDGALELPLNSEKDTSDASDTNCCARCDCPMTFPDDIANGSHIECT